MSIKSSSSRHYINVERQVLGVNGNPRSHHDAPILKPVMIKLFSNSYKNLIMLSVLPQLNGQCLQNQRGSPAFSIG